MKKLYATRTASNMKSSRFSFVNVSLLAAMTAFLSSVFPVFAGNFDLIEQVLQSMRNATAVYSQANDRSIVSAYDSHNSDVDLFDNPSVPKTRYLAALNRLGTPSATDSDYANFLTKMLLSKNGADANIIDVSDASRSGVIREDFRISALGTNNTILGNSESITFMDSDRVPAGQFYAASLGDKSVASGKNSISMGHLTESLGKGSAAIDSAFNDSNEYNNEKDKESVYTIAKDDYSLVIGATSKALAHGATVLGHRSYGLGDRSTSIGYYSEARTAGSVALGAYSLSDVVAGVAGYSPLLKKNATDTSLAWKSTQGAVSVGSSDENITRQIIRVAAGTQDTDAVNVAQLKSLQDYVDKGWKLLVGGMDYTAVSVDKTVNFSAGSSNLNITKDEDDNKLKFDLAEDITLSSAKVGEDTLDATDLIIANSPEITTTGIDAANKKITNVATGTQDTDIVNFTLLKAAQETAVIKGLQINTTGKDFADATAAAENSVALGSKASVDKLSSGSLALGVGASVKDYKSSKDSVFGSLNGIALGAGASVSGTHGVAIGAGAKSEGTSAFALGANAFSSTGGVAIGVSTESMVDSIAIGHNAKTNGQGSVVIGFNAKTQSVSSVAIGDGTQTLERDSIALGAYAKTEKNSRYSIAFGSQAQASAYNGIALGSYSVADVAGGISGYDPRLRKNSNEKGNAWVSSFGALSIGSGQYKRTRQIVGVAAGLEDTDAVNVAQLKALQDSMNLSWELSVNGANATIVNSTNSMDLVTGSSNLNITKGDNDNKVKFDLAQNVIVNSVEVGKGTLDTKGLKIEGIVLDETGLHINEGLQITTTGINAASSKITNVENGTDDNDAVNFSQLKEIKQQVASSSFVKQNTETKHITIGAETDGDKIDITDKDKNQRTLTGVKDGALSATSTEAVTGSQLFKTNNDVTEAKSNITKNTTDIEKANSNISSIDKNISQYLGGSADVLEGKKPSYTVQGTMYDNVTSAFAGVDSSITKIHNEISKKVDQNALLWDDSEGSFVAKHGGDGAKTSSKIKYLASGDLSASSTDAVTGSQLYSTNQKVDTVTNNLQTAATNIAKSFGGEAKYENGTWTPPTFKVTTIKEDGSSESKDYPDIASVFAGVGSSFTNVNSSITKAKDEISKEINNAITDVKGDSLVKKDKETNFITIGKEVEGDKIDITNKDKNQRTLTGIKAGELSATSTEAVTGSQLFKTDSNVSKNTTDLAQANIDIFRNAADIIQVSNNILILNENMSQYLGGDADVLGGKAPTFTVKGETYRDVSSAFAGIDQNALLWDDSEGSFVAKHGEKGKETSSKIKYLASGDLSASSMDAVTGSQLFETNQKVDTVTNNLQTAATNIAKSFGGEAKYENGTWTPPTFKVTTIKEDGSSESKDYPDIASVFAGVGSSFTNVNSSITKAKDEISKEINNAITDVKGDSLVKKDKETNFITIGKEVEGDKIDITNKDKNQRTLTGIKAGELSATSTEAVTGSQLFKTDSNVSKNTTDLAQANIDIFRNAADIIQVSNNILILNENMSQYLGGDADVLVGKAPTFTVKGETYRDVGSAFAGIDKNALLWDDSEGSFVAKHGEKGKETSSKIKYLAAGDLSASSTDAVNGSQLYSTNQKVDTVTNNLQTAATNIAKSFGGEAKYENGTWTPPTFKVTTIKKDGNSEEKTYNNVSDALVGVGSSFTNVQDKFTSELTTQINNAITDVKGDSLVKKDKATNLISIGAEIDGDKIDITNKNKENRTLTGIKDGTLSASSTDAVTGSQLFETNSNVTKNTADLAQANNYIFRNAADIVHVKTDIWSLDTNISQYLGGGADVLVGKAPTFTVKGETYRDVGSAFAGIDKNALLWDDSEGSFVAKHGEKGKETSSKIKYLAAGDLSASSTDAVNGSQLFETNDKFATYFGGGTKYENGTWTSPTFKVTTIKEDGNSEDKDYSDIASVFAGVGTSFTNVSSSITKVKDEISKKIDNAITDVKGNSLVKKEDTTNLITIGKEVEGDKIDITNKDKKQRILTGVKDGALSETSTEAVTGSQLFKTNNDVTEAKSNIAKNTTDIAKANSNISSIDKNISQYLGGGADVLEGKKPSYTVQGTTYDNVTSAFAGVDSSITKIHNEISKKVDQNALLWDDSEGSFVAKHGGNGAKTSSKIKYLAAGDLSASSTDAVTGSQLFETNQKVDIVTSNLQTAATNIAKSFGGEAKYENGTWTLPTFKVTTIKEDGNSEEKIYNNLSDVLAGVGSSFTNVQDKFTSELTTQINNAITDVKGDSLVKKDKVTNLITIGAEIDGDKIDITNKDKKQRTLTGVKDGTLSASSTDAVTGSQLFETDSNVSKNTADLAQANNYIFRNAADIVHVKTDIWSLDTNISQYLGGGADVLVGKAPTFTVKGETYRDVGSAFAGIDKNALLWDDSEGSFVAKHGEKGKETSSKIKYLAAGELSESSTDAVNGSQLYSTNQKVDTVTSNLQTAATNIAKSFGGGTKYENGTWTPPTFKVTTIKEDGSSEEKTYNNVSDALVGVGSSFTNVQDKFTSELTTQINNAITDVKGDSLVKKDKATNLISIGAEIDGDKIDITNKNKKKRTLTGVKDGTLSASSTDAVTGSQLFETDSNVSKNTADLAQANNYIFRNAADIVHVKTDIWSLDTNISQYLGGGADVLVGKAPTFTVKGETYRDVSSAFAGIDQNALLWDDSEGSFVAKHGGDGTKTSSKIKYLASGDLSESSTDAVTGSQLYSTNQKVDTVTNNLQTAATNIAKSFGGEAKYENGTWTPPTFKVTTIKEDGSSESKDYPDIASVFAGVGSSFTNVNSSITKAKDEISKEINNAITDVKGDSLVKKDKETNFITIGKEVEGDKIDITNKDKNQRTLTGIKAGELSATSTEAVTGSQLFKTDSNVSKNTTDLAQANIDIFRNAADIIQVSNNILILNENMSQYLGGDADVLVGKAPTFTVKGETYRDVGSAFAGIDKNALLWDDSEGSFVAKHGEKGKETSSKIKYLAAGDLSASSTDAVNGSQLFETNDKFATYFGGGTKYENGTWTSPTFKVTTIKEDGNSEDKDYSDIASVFADVGTSFTNVNSSITKVKDEISKKIDNAITDVKGNSLVKKEDTTNLITIGKEVEGDKIDITNKDKKQRILTGVKDGALSATSTEAVTGSQLFKTNNDVTEAKSNITKNTTDIAKANSNISSIDKNISQYLGGGADVLEGKKPSYTVQDTTYDNVTSAFAGVDSSITKIHNEIAKKVDRNALLWDDSEGSFVAKHGEKGEETSSKIKYLAAGDLSESSTDAVTGSQLYSTNQKVDTVTSNLQTAATNIAKSFGGGTKYENGTWTPPTFKVTTIKEDGNSESKDYPDIASVFADVGTSFTNVNSSITKAKNEISKEINNAITDVKGDSLVKKDKETNFITIGKEVDGDKIDIINKDKENRTLTGVKDGTLSASSTDAVNGSQLYSTNQKVDTVTSNLQTAAMNIAKSFGGEAKYENGTWTPPTFKVTTIKEDGNSESKDYSDIASVFAGVGTSFTNVSSSITKVKDEISKKIDNAITDVKGDSLVKKEGTTNRITIGKEVEGSEINIANNSGADRTLSGVKEATQNNEAVNKGQFDKGLKDFSNSLQSDDSAVVHYDKKKSEDDAIDYTSVTLGKGNGSTAVGLHNVADGNISKGSRDAITGGQIDKISQDVAKYLGGDAAFTNGAFTGPIYKLSKVDIDGNVENATFNDVGTAFDGLDTSIKNVNQRIKEVSQGVAQDSLSWSKNDSAFVAQHGDGSERTNSKIKYLAAGELSESSTDAVTGSQLFETNSNVTKNTTDLAQANNDIFRNAADIVHVKTDIWSLGTNISQYLGGGADVLQDKKPSYTVQGTEYNDVGSAFAGVSSSITDVHNEIKTEINKVISDSLVKQDEKTHVINIGKEVEGSEINIANNEGAERTLSGVKEATQNNEAVNKGQLDKSLKDLSANIQSGDSAVVLYDKKEGDNGETDYTSVTFGKGKGSAPVGLHNVADGNIASGSHDAVNGGQINTISQDVAKFLGGEAAFSNGVFTAPTYKISNITDDGTVTDKSHNDVDSAFAGLDASVKNVNTHLTNEVKKFDEKITNIAQHVKGDALLWSKSDNAFIALHGEEDKKTNSKIKFLANGDITDGSTDAVTGGQLHTLGTGVASTLGGSASYENGIWTAPTFKVKIVNEAGTEVEDKDYSSVAAAFEGIGTSFANLHKEVTESNTEVTEQIKQNALLWSDADNAFVALHEKDGAKVNGKITHLQAGELSAISTEAVNGSQLYSLNETLAKYFGGGAGYDAEGNWQAPSFIVKTVKEGGESKETSYTNVSEALTGVGSSITNVKNELTAQINNEISSVKDENLVKQDKTTHLINLGKEVEGSEINITNKNGIDRILSGVKAAENDNEAVNKGQLDKSLAELSANIQSDDSAVVLYDKKEDGETNYTSVTFGKGNDSAPVGLHNVADGQIASGSHDAVNGGQIDKISQDVAQYLGGDAGFKDGAFTGLTYKLSEVDADGQVLDKSFNDVGSAFTGLDMNIKNVNSNLTNKFNELNQSITNITEEVKGDALLWDKEEEAFVVKHGKDGAKTNSKITHLADGNIASGSTEAVTGGQLYSLKSTLAKYFDGGAGYDAEGNWQAPSFIVKTVKEGGESEETSYTSVAEALTGVGSSITNVKNELTTQINNEINNVVSESLVKQDTDTHVIAIGAEKNGTKVTLANIDGAARTLTGVRTGALSANSTDAVNGSQLYSLNKTLATYFGGDAGYEDGEWKAPSFIVKIFGTDGTEDEKSYDNVAEAFAGVNTAFTNIKNEVNNKINNVVADSLVKQDADTKIIKIGGEKSGTKVTLANVDAAARTLTGVKAGALSELSTDAVNGSQVYFLNQTLAAYFGGGAGYNDGKWTSPTFNVVHFKEDGTADDKKYGYNSVAEAFDGVSGSMLNINDRIRGVEKNVASNGLNWNKTEGAYDGRHNEEDSKITHVADGKVEEGSKEVVNGGQLWETNKKVTAVEDKVNTIDKKVQGVAVAADGAVKYDKDSDGKKKNRITLVGGDESAPVLIDNVGDGTIETGSKEAVNGGQLHDYTEQQMKIVLDDANKYTDERLTNAMGNVLNDVTAYTDMKFEALSYDIEDVRKEARQAAAIGLAVSNLRYYDTPGSLSVSFGTGVWRSQSAFAIGAGYTSEDGNVRSNLSVTSAGGHWGIGAGITLRLR
ncbi:Vomp family autotransporter [Bartonella sp. B39]